LPALQTFPFGSEFFGDDGQSPPAYQRKVTTYYKMIARDNGTAGTSPTYRTWVVTNSPDTDGSKYPAGSPKIGNLVDIAIASSWEVSDP
jgi:hypothetical protein